MASPKRLERLLLAAGAGKGGVLGEMLRARVPIHFGGMADPFPRMEDRRKVSLDLLSILAKFQYPTILSAKGVPSQSGRYIDVISAGRMMVQFSFTVVDPDLAAGVDAGVPAAERRFAFMRDLAAAKVPVSMRLQPVFAGHEAHAEKFMVQGAAAGARHVAVEFLKYPVEANWAGMKRLTIASGMQKGFFDLGATLVGREWVLPTSYRAVKALEMKRMARSLGMTFAFADNDLLHFSDGLACCTGSDLYLNSPGIGFNFHRAVKRCDQEGRIIFSSIESEWRPSGSVAQYINSNSRARGRTLNDLIVNGWNNSVYAPNSFYGVSDSGELDESGLRIYVLDPKLRQTYGH